MKRVFLEVTYRRGRPFAAYLYLGRAPGERVASTTEARPGVLVDYGAEGQAMGVEIVHPGATRLATVREVLEAIGWGAVPAAELTPLRAA